METASGISSNSTKSKRSFVKVFSRLFKRSKSANSSQMTVLNRVDDQNVDSLVDSHFNMDKQITEDQEDNDNEEDEFEGCDKHMDSRKQKSASKIEIIVQDIHNNVWFPELQKKNLKNVVLEEDNLSLTEFDIQQDVGVEDDTKRDSKISIEKENLNDEVPTGEMKTVPQYDDHTETFLFDDLDNANDKEYLQVLPMNIETRYAGQDFTDDQLPQFCEQLHGLIDVIKNIQANSKSFSSYARDLQQLLENDVKELDLIYAEMRCVKSTIEQIKKQRDLINTGKLEAIEQLTILENEEFDEIEKSINIHDTPIYKSWERTKRSRTLESFEKLIKDIHTNQEALKNLEVLVKNRKAKINYMNKRFRSTSGPVNETNANAVMPMNAIMPSNESPFRSLAN